MSVARAVEAAGILFELNTGRQGVLDMAGDLGLVTVCEGVETEDQAAMLSELGCPVAQGYAFSKPLPEGEFRTRYGL